MIRGENDIFQLDGVIIIFMGYKFFFLIIEILNEGVTQIPTCMVDSGNVTKRMLKSMRMSKEVWDEPAHAVYLSSCCLT